MTAAEIAKHFPHATADFIRANASDLPKRFAPAPVLERRKPHEPMAPDVAKTCDSAEYIVRVTSYRCRLLDDDNLCEKFHVDGLRYAGLLPSDAPDRCRIFTTQEKVRKKAHERTEIVIERVG